MGPSPYQSSRHCSKIMERLGQTLAKYPNERPADRRSPEVIAAEWFLVAKSCDDPNCLVIPFSQAARGSAAAGNLSVAIFSQRVSSSFSPFVAESVSAPPLLRM